MLTNGTFSNEPDYKYYPTLGKDIILAYLHMVKLAQENHIVWSDRVQIKE